MEARKTKGVIQSKAKRLRTAVGNVGVFWHNPQILRGATSSDVQRQEKMGVPTQEETEQNTHSFSPSCSFCSSMDCMMSPTLVRTDLFSVQ
jgi:hypothetical protein